MMNKRAKGNRLENEVKEIFKSQGFTVHKTYPSLIYNRKTGRYFCRSNDVFECFDLICKKKNEPTYWVQVTNDMKNKSNKEKKILERDIFNFEDRVEIWIKDKRKWRRFRMGTNFHTPEGRDFFEIENPEIIGI